MTEVLVWAGFVVGGIIGVVAWIAASPTPNEHLKCPHCGTTGQVLVSTVERNRGISGAKATGAIATGGLSLFATGLSRHELVRHLKCQHCQMEWDVS